MRKSLFWVGVLLSALVPVGCAASSTATGAGPRTVRVGFADSGRTVHVRPGDVVVVRLHSTYWSFGTVAGDTLHQQKAVVHAVPIGRTVPGSGEGTVTVGYQAMHRGRQTITATRRVCGEAMSCVGKQGSFWMFVVVR